MITTQAQSGFEHIFKKAVTSNLMSADDHCDIQCCEAAEYNETEFAILTVSSPIFRFLAIFHFDSNESTQRYFSKQSGNGMANSFDNAACHDAFLEFCNLCCGSMNRDFLNFYPYLGMSTPYVLLKESSSFISALEPGYLKHYRIAINHALILHATLCVCDYGMVDFKVDENNLVEDTGELELF